MFLFIIIPLSMQFNIMRMSLTNSLNYNINMNMNRLNQNDISWEKTNNCKNIIHKYFYNMNKNNYENNNNNYYGEIFKIFGYPATIVIVNNKLKTVEEFIINKNLMLMFDAGTLIRFSFYKNFKNLNIKNALNKDIFLII